MKRVALFAHFDENDEIKPFICYFLARLLTVCSRIVFVSTANLAEEELAKVRPYAHRIFLRDNRGFDFAMWRDALDRLDIRDYDEIIFTNSSILGPIYELGPIFEQMSAEPCDFWGMTESFELRWHLQSYFLVLKKSVLASEAFARFWQSVLPYRDKQQVTFSYELGLSSFLVDQGFCGRSFIPVDSWAGSSRFSYAKNRRRNPSLCFPLRLLDLGMPFIKVSVFRDNPYRVSLGPLLRVMRQAGYPADQLPVGSAASIGATAVVARTTVARLVSRLMR